MAEVWRSITVHSHPDWEVEVQTGVVQSKTRLTGLRISTDSFISAEDLRGFPVRAAIAAAKQMPLPHPEWTTVPRRKGVETPAEHYKYIAEARQLALEVGIAPGNYIMHVWGVNRDTVAKWLRTSRLMGYWQEAK